MGWKGKGKIGLVQSSLKFQMLDPKDYLRKRQFRVLAHIHFNKLRTGLVNK